MSSARLYVCRKVRLAVFRRFVLHMQAGVEIGGQNVSEYGWDDEAKLVGVGLVVASALRD